MFLSHLPSDLLALVLSEHSSYLVIDLYKCGDSLLNYKLANGGCTEVRLSDNNCLTTSRYPKMLSTLHHLRLLDISRATSLLLPPMELSLEIQKLSSSLEVLRIACENAGISILNFNAYDSSYHTVTTPAGPCRAWDIASRFPKLHTLILEPSKLGAEFQEADLTALPESLTKLEISGFNFDQKNVISTFPPNLKHLAFNSPKRGRGDDKASLVRKLPAGLVTLQGISILVDWDHFEIGDRALLLPRSLEQLTQWDYEALYQWSPDLQSLPPSLTKLSIMLGPDAEASLIDIGETFPNLRALTVRDSSGTSLTQSMTAILPRSLKELKWESGANWNTWIDGEPSLWPKELSVLHLAVYEGQATTPSHALRHLPRSLTEVSMYLPSPVGPDTEDGALSLQLLPPGLISLKAVIYRPTRVLQEGAPKSLRNVAVTRGRWEGFTFCLPSITDLKGHITMSIDPSLGIGALISPGMRSIDVERVPAEIFSLLPLSLEKLSVVRVAPPYSALSLANLPPGLIQIIIKGHDDALLEIPHAEQSFAGLTRLETLRMPEKYSFPGRVLRNLPQTIKWITMKISSLEVEDLQALPQSLDALNIGEILSPTMWEHFPVWADPPPHWKRIELRLLSNRLSEAIARSDICPDPRVRERLNQY